MDNKDLKERPTGIGERVGSVRVEAPSADDQKMFKELSSHFSSLPDNELKKAYDQTLEGAKEDALGYEHGGNPSNAGKTIAILQTEMDKRKISY